MKFTDVGIKALKPKDKRYVAWKDNGNGFGVRVSPKGNKSFIFFYRFNDRPRMMTLGSYPEMSLQKAGVAHAKAREKLGKGEDPGIEAVKQRRADRLSPKVKMLVEEYLERWAKPHKRSWKEDERILKKEIVPAIGHLKVNAVKKRDIIAILDGIIDRGAPIQANRTLAVIRKMFNFAVQRDIIEIPPCYGLKAPSKEKQRDRVLSDGEIKHFWNNLDTAPINLVTRLALKFQLVTAQRKAEVVTAHWNDIQGDVWTIPAEKAKNGFAHTVPLSAIALEILEESKKLSHGKGYIFPASRKGPLSHIGFTTLDHALRKNLNHLGITERFTPHDLRRTAATKMAEKGVLRLTISKILNHAEQSVTAVYDRYTYMSEKRAALNKWAAKLKQIITGKKAKVVNIR